MDQSKYTQLYNSDGVKIAGFDTRTFDAAALAPVLRTLSIENPPQGATLVISHNAEHKWGQDIFTVGGIFLKGYWTYRHADRVAPYVGCDKLIGNWETCAAAGIPVPEYRGVYAVQEDDKWMWSGIVAENLVGWRNLDKTSADDQALMYQAIDAFASKGVLNRDMHCGNVMTDGNGNYKVVDLDNLAFGQIPAEAKETMLAFFRESLNWPD